MKLACGYWHGVVAVQAGNMEAQNSSNSPGAAQTHLSLGLMKIAPALRIFGTAVDKAAVPMLAGWEYACILYQSLPTDTITAVYGLAVCFFGGYFANSIAAIEAFQQTGWKSTWSNLQKIRQVRFLPAFATLYF